jgi:hypothetical protein
MVRKYVMARGENKLIEHQLTVIEHCRMRRIGREATQGMLRISRATYYRRLAILKQRLRWLALKPDEKEKHIEELYNHMLRNLPVPGPARR